MTMKETSSEDPQKQGAKPPFPNQDQNPPGLEGEMRPTPDYGEQSYQGHNRLTGKTAIITGGDSGIGRAVALAFAREGADVVISYLNEVPDAQEIVQAVKEAGRTALPIAGDISSEEHCQHIVQQTVKTFGKIDILVNNAAFQMMYANIQQIPSDEFDYTMRTNLYAMFYLSIAALPHMPPGSTIINTSSIQAYQPTSSLLPYAITKGAIVTFTKALAQEVIEQGVRVNCVASGPVWTPLIPTTTPAEGVSKFGQQTPIGRPAQPAELAPLYVFLASPESSYICGEIIGVTGGKPLI